MGTLSIFDAARERPSAVAFVAAGRRWSFADAARACAPLAMALWETAPPALTLRPRADAESLLWLYAAFATGTPVLTLHARSTPSEAERCVALAGSREPPAPRPGRFDEAAVAGVEPGRTLAIIPTSGSSGAPRLVAVSRRAALASAAASAANLGWELGDRWLLCLPLAHAGGLSIVVRCLLGRATVLAFDGAEAGVLSRLPELTRALDDATLVSLVPSVLDALLAQGFVAPPRLRAVLIGGAGCAPALSRRAHAAGLPLLTSYGLTETASQVVTRPYAERHEPLPERGGVVSSGVPLAGVDLRLDSGRIAIRAPSLFDGYLGEGPASLDPDGFFLTSDHGEIGPRGELYVRGRVDDVIVSGGENVDPLEVEAALLTLPGVAAACVFGSTSARFGQVVTAALVTRDARLSDPTCLGQLLADRLARHKHPRRAVLVERLPLTASGKVDRRACASELAARLESTDTP